MSLPRLQALATAKQDAQAVAGHYINNRRSEHGPPTVLNAFGQVTITAHEDGSITGVSKRPNSEYEKLREVAPFVFRDEDSEDPLSNSGKTTRDAGNGISLHGVPAHEFLE